LFIFACGRIFSPKTIRPGGDFVRRLLGYFRLRPEFQPENHPPWRGLYPKVSLVIFACDRNFDWKTDG